MVSIRDDQWLRNPADILSDESRDHRDALIRARVKLQALLFENRSQGLPTPWLQLRAGPYWPVLDDPLKPRGPIAPVYVEEFLRRWPERIGERLNRALGNIARLSPTLGTTVGLDATNRQPLLFATDDDEAYYIVKALEAAEWIKARIMEGWKADLVVSPAGWSHIAELESRLARSSTNPAFVAMWFGDDSEEETTSFMSELFEKHLKPAIEKASYKSDRVDLVPHNDFVMDKVLGMIRVAPFVVADFTGNRNGVYFEAGFARGLGIPVIHTCRKKHFEEAHFDIKQVNTIVWSKPEDLAEKLYHRIAGTLGPGPYPSDSNE